MATGEVWQSWGHPVMPQYPAGLAVVEAVPLSGDETQYWGLFIHKLTTAET